MALKPWPGPPALALSYAEPSQSRCWAVTFGPAWPGLNGLNLARLPALSQAKQNTSYLSRTHILTWVIAIRTSMVLLDFRVYSTQ